MLIFTVIVLYVFYMYVALDKSVCQVHKHLLIISATALRGASLIIAQAYLFIYLLLFPKTLARHKSCSFEKTQKVKTSKRAS